MGKENELIIFIASILLIAVYICGIFLTYVEIDNQRKRYYNKYEGLTSLRLLALLSSESKSISTFGALVFPLYWCFMGGCYFGDKVYEILIDKNDENRIASWVV